MTFGELIDDVCVQGHILVQRYNGEKNITLYEEECEMGHNEKIEPLLERTVNFIYPKVINDEHIVLIIEID